jgi:hypothetical protein
MMEMDGSGARGLVRVAAIIRRRNQIHSCSDGAKDRSWPL